MNILSMLARLEHALGCNDLTKQMVLRPPRSKEMQFTQNINLVVGYNASPQSQTALDLTLWIAHQTRLATPRQVTVQVVYVVNWEDECGLQQPVKQAASERLMGKAPGYGRKGSGDRALGDYGQSRHPGKGSNSALADRPEPGIPPQACQTDQFEQADRILWQARTLADEWRGSLKTHLRFGKVAQELRQVVQAESAAVLVLGCNSPENGIVQQLGPDFPCPVLGIPPAL